MLIIIDKWRFIQNFLNENRGSMKQNNKFDVPILFITYNRLETVKQVFGKIKEVQPKILYIASDGPKDDNDLKKIVAVRDWIINHVDWECRVEKNFANSNQGCKYGPAKAIDWIFSMEEKAIILEDDVVPDKSFFPFCEKMLSWYMQDEDIMLISGYKDIYQVETPNDYFFSRIGSIWGWATWRRAWDKYDINMYDWPSMRENSAFWEKFRKSTKKHLIEDFDMAYNKKIDAWDFQWYFARLKNKGLSILPSHSLVANIGYGENCGTHTTNKIQGEVVQPIDVYFQKKLEIKVFDKYDREYEKKMYPNNFWKRNVKKILKRFCG